MTEYRTAAPGTPKPVAVWLDEPTVLPESFLDEARRDFRLEVYGGLPDPAEVIRRLDGADLAVVEWTPFDAELLGKLRTVRHLCLVTTAWDHVDVAAARRLGITVTNCPTYSAASVAEYAVSAFVAADRDLRGSHAEAARGRSHLYHPFLGRGLEGQVLGLVGLGAIGRAVASRAAALGMTVIGCNGSGAPVPGVGWLPLREVLHQADYLSVQVPYSPATHHLLDASMLDLMPRHAVLVNVSRAGVIDETALIERLGDGRLRAAVVDDVTDPAAARLAACPNALVTTGIAWFTQSAIDNNFAELLATIRSCRTGQPMNVIKATSR